MLLGQCVLTRKLNNSKFTFPGTVLFEALLSQQVETAVHFKDNCKRASLCKTRMPNCICGKGGLGLSHHDYCTNGWWSSFMLTVYSIDVATMVETLLSAD